MIIPSSTTLDAVTNLKYPDASSNAWGPRLRREYGYFTPDDWYEALLLELVGAETRWLDVGCGRAPFPSNDGLAQLLAARCRTMVGLDPSDNIEDNPFLHERTKTMLEDFTTAEPFDLITLRMVAEHIADPDAAASALARLLAPGGKVVIYTVYRWSPVSVVSSLTPMRFHHWAKHMLWGGEERDTFPTTYLMNTRRNLSDVMGRHGLRETSFQVLSDTRTTNQFKRLNTVELSLWKGLRRLGVDYPERCFIAVFQPA